MQNEQYEWCEFWWEEIDRGDRTRILLIGDSIAKGYRPYLCECFGDAAFVDLYASSRAVDNPALDREILHALDAGRQRTDIVLFNNGLHGGHLQRQGYEEGVHRILHLLAGHFGDATLFLATSTPVSRTGGAGMTLEETQAFIEARNDSVRSLADSHGLRVVDLHAVALGREELKQEDGVHFNEAGCRELANTIAAAFAEVSPGMRR
jgi:hypothetical protein